MTEPLYEPQASDTFIRDFLKQDDIRALFPGPYTTALNLPGDWTPDQDPHIGVFSDGGPFDFPIRTRDLIRITVWARGKTPAQHFSHRALAVLLGRPIPGVGKVSDPTTVLYARDTDNDGIMGSFHLEASTRTKAIV